MGSFNKVTLPIAAVNFQHFLYGHFDYQLVKILNAIW